MNGKTGLNFFKAHGLRAMAALSIVLALPAAAAPCDSTGRTLKGAWKDDNVAAITRHVRRDLGLTGPGVVAAQAVDIHRVFHYGIWTIVNVNALDKEETYLFYRKPPREGRDFIAAFSGEVKPGEAREVRKWLVKNVLGLPKPLSECFVWHVTVERHKPKK
jgi:hypothetical protein